MAPQSLPVVMPLFSGAHVGWFLEHTQVSVVAVNFPYDSMFPRETLERLGKAVRGAKARVDFAVASPESLQEAVGELPRSGEFAVFEGPRLVGRFRLDAAQQEWKQALQELDPQVRAQREKARLEALLRGITKAIAARIRAKDAKKTAKESAKPKNVVADPYATLELKPGASRQEIKTAQKTLLKQYHPDLFQRAGSKIQVVASEETARINAAADELLKLVTH